MNAPSPRSIEIAMSVAQATLARLRDSAELDIETDETDLLTMLGEAGVEAAALLERVVAAALEAGAMAEACASRIDQLLVRKQRFERLEQTWRGTAMAMMDVLDMRKHKAAEFTATLGDGLPRAVITDEAELPEEYWRITREPNKIAIKADLAEGVVIPGAELSNGPPRLILRTR